MNPLRTALIRASESDTLRRQVSSRPLTRRLALRYVAGETLEDGLAVTRRLCAEGKTVTLDYVGESVREADEARAACKVYLEALDRVGAEGLDCGVSVKPTQMGIELSEGLCLELLGEIVAAAERIGVHVTLDMEGSDLTEATVRLVEQLHAAGHTDVGCALQAYLQRTRADVERLSRIGASVRLCKGAYAEPATIAYQRRIDVDRNYARCAAYLLEHGTYPRLATHDERLIARARYDADRLGRSPDEYEFQMLYGVRPSLQDRLVAEGHRVRVYVPFGSEWYAYFVRRIAERPANVLFFLRSLRDT